MPWLPADVALEQLESDLDLTVPTDGWDPEPEEACDCQACEAHKREVAQAQGPIQPPQRRARAKK